MLVPDKQRRKEGKKKSLASVFFFLFLIFLFSSIVFYYISPASADDNEERISIVLIDGEEIYVRSGSSHTFLQDYQLYIKGTDIEGERIWIELSRNGTNLQDAIVTEGSQFAYSKNSTEILNLTVNTIYKGADGVLVKFSPVYQYLDPQLPMPQTPAESLDNASDNASSANPELETQARGFNIPLFLLVLGTVFLVTGFFAGKGNKK